MSKNKSDSFLSLANVLSVSNTCEEALTEQEFSWGGDNHILFEDAPVELDMEYFVKEDKVDQMQDVKSDFKVLGDEKFVNLKKIQIRPGWIAAAKVFEKDIDANTCENLKSFPGLKPLLYRKIKEHIASFFPVQAAVFSYLLPLSSSIPLFPPRDIAISAPTGSGKTLCYILPILNGLEHSDPTAVFAVIIAPLQLLAVQIYEEFKKYNIFDVSISLLAGVQDYANERRLLFPNDSKKSRTSIIIATPDRFVEHLTDISGKVELSKLRYLVIDEADRMKNIARLEWLNLLEERANVKTANSTSISRLQSPDQNRFLQKILVSATLNLDVERLFIWNLRCPRLFRSTGQNNENKDEAEQKPNSASVALPSTMTHKVIICDMQRKPLDLFCWIRKNPDWKRFMIFVNSNETLQRLTTLLEYMFKKDKKVAGLCGEHFKQRRMRTLKQFSTGEISILISSDGTGRGVDIPDIDCVINYDLPRTDRTFVHRAGRTARAGKAGTVLSFATKEEKMGFKKILAERGYWNSVIEVRKEDISETKDRASYKKALEKLQAAFSKNAE